MRCWNKTREGSNFERGVRREDEKEAELSRRGCDVDSDQASWRWEARGFERSDVLRRRTGPGPDADDDEGVM